MTLPDCSKNPTWTFATGAPSSVTVAVSVWVGADRVVAGRRFERDRGLGGEPALGRGVLGLAASLVLLSFESTKAVIVSCPALVPV